MLFLFNNDNNGGRSSIDAKFIGILSLFLFFGILLVTITILAAETLTALRSYATTQTHWTEVRKEAVGELENYITTRSESYYKDYQNKITVLQDLKKARTEVIADQTDPQKVISLFDHFRFREGEIRDMIKLADRFSNLPELAEALHVWQVSDQQIERLDSLASQIHRQQSSSLGKEQWLKQVETIDKKLTELQYDLAFVLSQGTQRLENIIFWAAIGTGMIVILVGGFMSWRFLKSMRKWEYALNLNMQKYRSLFDQNPNIVYSFDRDGKFINGNAKLEDLLDTPLEKIKGLTFDQFIHPTERKRVRHFFEKAADGNPQTYETLGVNNKGEQFHLQITNLPIFVEDKIVGVYGIARNIDERVKAEQKNQTQLKERTVLLEEIHHRVKNNLAFVSSMLMLNEEDIDNEKARQKLKEAQNQIVSIADIHEIFYQTEDFSELPVERYAEKILSRLSESVTLEGKAIKHTLQVDEEVNLTINKAIPFGLILNELATNSYKHAFDNSEEGIIAVDVQSVDGEVQVIYRDNGEGLSSDFTIKEAGQSSLGMRLIHTFLQQLEADFNLSTGDDEFRLAFSFAN